MKIQIVSLSQKIISLDEMVLTLPVSDVMTNVYQKHTIAAVSIVGIASLCCR
jgi:hypothetical protein